VHGVGHSRRQIVLAGRGPDRPTCVDALGPMPSAGGRRCGMRPPLTDCMTDCMTGTAGRRRTIRIGPPSARPPGHAEHGCRHDGSAGYRSGAGTDRAGVNVGSARYHQGVVPITGWSETDGARGGASIPIPAGEKRTPHVGSSTELTPPDRQPGGRSPPALGAPSSFAPRRGGDAWPRHA
jgi:hypothetical protein